MTEHITPKILLDQNIIKTGALTATAYGNRAEVQYEMRFLNSSHLKEMLALQDFIKNELSDKRVFVPDDKDFLLKQVLMPNRGRAIGVFVNHSLIAFRTITFPGKNHHNLGRDLKLTPQNLMKVAHLESTVVHPFFRGNGLQAKMLMPTLDIIKASGYSYVLVTISPFNYPSLSTIIKANFLIRDLKSRGGVYNGKIRCLLFKDLNKSGLQEYQDIVSIPNSMTYKQEKLLKEGYVGFGLEKAANAFNILYGK